MQRKMQARQAQCVLLMKLAQKPLYLKFHSAADFGCIARVLARILQDPDPSCAPRP